MEKRILTLVVALFSLFFNVKISAQSYKSETLFLYNYVLPESYLPINYYSYGVKINLPADRISVIIDDEKKSTRDPLTYNVFFTEKDLIRPLSGLTGNEKGVHIPTILELGYTSQPAESNEHLIIDIFIKNVAYAADISENKALETPFTYEIYYKYDVVYKIVNSLTKAVIMEKTYNIKEKTRDLGGFEGSKSGFKTKPEAIAYLDVNIDKILIYNELVTDIQRNMRMRLGWWIDVDCYQGSFFFSRISKEDKNPLFLKLNQDVDVLEKWSKGKADPVTDDALIAANTEFIEKNNLGIKDDSRYFQDETGVMNYKKFLDEKRVFTDFILKMDQYAKQLDPNDKGQKAALWACYINIASSFEVLNNFESSLEYLQKARALNYQESKIKYAETGVVKKLAKKKAFFDANGEVKKDVNTKYLKYLSL